MRLALAFLAICHLALLGGCGETPDETPDPPIDEGKVIAVPPGSSISVEAGPDGDVKIVIIVPDGQPGAGTYTSTSPHLLPGAQTAMKTLGDPGVEVSIKVDGSGEIQSLSDSVTLR
jgi:hypothetical protein